MKFTDLGLAEPILRAVAAEGYHTATPIQAQTIPHVLAGKDVVGCAQTGTGKTAAFALPVLHQLSLPRGANIPAEQQAAPGTSEAHPVNAPRQHSKKRRPRSTPRNSGRLPRALVIAPTRELAQQIADSFKTYGRNMNLSGTVIYGGVGQSPQTKALHEGVDIVVATPGRLLDLINQGHCKLSAVEVLVLDEADRMLDMGFMPDIKRIIATLPQRKQTLLFSATMPPAIRQFANSLLTKPAEVTITPDSPAVERIAQTVYHVDRPQKPALLLDLLETASVSRAIVFTRTKHGADRVTKHLNRYGGAAEAIHGNKTQGARSRTLDRFRSGKLSVLVATDIAARGIDVDGISHVINYDIARDPESHVHRIGRTARAGAEGAAISFCDAEEVPLLRAIERLIRMKIEVIGDEPHHARSFGDRPGKSRNSGGKPRGNKSRGRAPRSAAKRGGNGGGGGNNGGGYGGGQSASAKPRSRKPRQRKARTRSV